VEIGGEITRLILFFAAGAVRNDAAPAALRSRKMSDVLPARRYISRRDRMCASFQPAGIPERFYWRFALWCRALLLLRRGTKGKAFARLIEVKRIKMTQALDAQQELKSATE